VDELNAAERWAPIPGCEGHFEVSDLGRVRSMDRILESKNGRKVRHRGRLLKLAVSNSGYLYLRLYIGGKGKAQFVHSLVLLAFVGPRPEGMECCHNNGDQLDNRLANLRWGTHGENVLDQERHGTNSKRNRTHCPHDHLLVEPNIDPQKAARGHRACRACHRAHDYGRHCKAFGHPFDFKTEADEYYRRIMAGDTGTRKKTCNRGHLLEQPNLCKALAARGRRSCLACKRAQNNAQDAKRAGRPFDFQAVADRHYERIMANPDQP
jgi:hypothetical protein